MWLEQLYVHLPSTSPSIVIAQLYSTIQVQENEDYKSNCIESELFVSTATDLEMVGQETTQDGWQAICFTSHFPLHVLEHSIRHKSKQKFPCDDGSWSRHACCVWNFLMETSTRHGDCMGQEEVPSAIKPKTKSLSLSYYCHLYS